MQVAAGSSGLGSVDNRGAHMISDEKNIKKQTSSFFGGAEFHRFRIARHSIWFSDDNSEFTVMDDQELPWPVPGEQCNIPWHPVKLNPPRLKNMFATRLALVVSWNILEHRSFSIHLLPIGAMTCCGGHSARSWDITGTLCGQWINHGLFIPPNVFCPALRWCWPRNRQVSQLK